MEIGVVVLLGGYHETRHDLIVAAGEPHDRRAGLIGLQFQVPRVDPGAAAVELSSPPLSGLVPNPLFDGLQPEFQVDL